MSKGFRSERDRRARIEEIHLADEAQALFDSPALEAWKQARVKDVLDSLASADSDEARIMVQARLVELNSLAQSLRQAVQTGSMARTQVETDNRMKAAKRETRQPQGVSNE